MLINNSPISEILHSAGIIKPKSNEEGNRLKEILSDSGLSLEEVISELSNVVKGSGDESLKLRGIDTALKLHGAMKEEDKSIPQITINIQAPQARLADECGADESEETYGIPSIFIPRALPHIVDIREANQG